MAATTSTTGVVKTETIKWNAGIPKAGGNNNLRTGGGGGLPEAATTTFVVGATTFA